MEYGLNEKIKNNLENLGYKEFTKIQKEVIPIALSGKDIIGKSQTGTGKTAAFLIPIIEKVEKNKGSQAIILSPTRELAIQIKEESSKISKGLDISTFAVYGGERIEPQISYLKNRKPEIIIGTPGRIIDHLKRDTLSLSKIKFFVLDEVDEMVNKGFIDDIRFIGKELKKSSEEVQSLLFSATISKETEGILDEFLRKDKIFIDNKNGNQESGNSLIKQFYMPIEEKASRIESLVDMIYFQDPKLSIIFASTKKLVDKISEELTNQGFSVEKIHSDLTQNQRTNVYNRLKNGKIKILIATDIAARGIDVEGVSHVYNYDCPQDLQFYLHRIGRTGRAGSSGESLIIVKKWERNQILQMEKLTNSKMQPLYKPSEDQIKEIIKNQAVEKMIIQIEKFKNQEIDQSIKNVLKNYDPENILKAFFNTVNFERKPVKEIDEENFRRRGRGNFGRSFNNDSRNNNKKDRFFKDRKRNFNYYKQS